MSKKEEINVAGTMNTCSNKMYINSWSLKPENLKDSFEHSFVYTYAHNRSVLSIALDESGTYMATASADHSIRLHNLKSLTTTKELYHKECGHTDWVNKVFFTKKNEVLSGGLDGKLCLWNTSVCCKLPKQVEATIIYDIPKYKELEKKVKEVHFKASTNALKCKEIVAHYSTISDMKFDIQNDKCITSSYDKTLKLFDLKKMREEQFYKGTHFAPITKFLWMENKIVSADKNGSLCVFDYQTNQEIAKAPKAHHGNIGDMSCVYFYEHHNLNLLELETLAEKKEKTDIANNTNKKEKTKNFRNKPDTNTIRSQFLFGNKDTHINPTQEPKTPLIVTGGQTDGVISIRDLRIFNKEINKKQIHKASINSILTYHWNNKNYIISCAADGYCYQFEIANLCEPNLKQFCKQIYVNEPILTARYIGNHQVAVGTCNGNIHVLNFGHSYNSNVDSSNIQIPRSLINHTGDSSSMYPNQVKTEILMESKDKEPTNTDILWAYGACSKGGINSIECTYIYNTKKLQTNEIELHSIIAAGDDGCPIVLLFSHKYL